MKKNKKQCFGVIIGTRAYFNSELARDVRKQLLKTLEDEGYDYVILPEDVSSFQRMQPPQALVQSRRARMD